MRMMWNESEEEAVALLPEEKQQAVRAYCDAILTAVQMLSSSLPIRAEGRDSVA